MGNGSKDFQLASCTVCPSANRVCGPDGEVSVGARAMDVLVYMASRQPDVVSRAELIENVWPGKVVVDDALSRCIWELRHAFKDAGETTEVIETVRSRGYRISVPTVETGDTGRATST